MKKILIIFIFTIIFFSVGITYANDNIEKINIVINGKDLDGLSFYKTINKLISKNSNNDLIIKKRIYNELINKIDFLKPKIGNINVNNLKEILYYGRNNVIKELEKKYSQLNQITLGYTQNGKPIIAYYKGNPEKGFFGIFANIHGGYEYGTYNTALFLLEELNKSGKTGRFIIPTINPEGLDYYLNGINYKNFYIKGRINSNKVDINRNFCTKSFELKTFIKNGEYLETGIGHCNSEKETQIIINTLNKYKFNNIVSLHSEGNIFYLPENSFDDVNVISFGKKLKSLLPSFIFDIEYNNLTEKKQKIYEYELDEGGSKKYTGTMETFIYEKYNIPAINIELKNHGKIEYELKNLINLLK